MAFLFDNLLKTDVKTSDSRSYSTQNNFSSQYDYNYSPQVIINSPNSSPSMSLKKEQTAVQSQAAKQAQTPTLTSEDPASGTNWTTIALIGAGAILGFALLKR